MFAASVLTGPLRGFTRVSGVLGIMANVEPSGTIADKWDQVAEGFDERVTPINVESGEDALALVDLGPGTRFLDVAAGSGALSLPAARSGADVVATDISPVMVERLEARARGAGLSNLKARVMDGMDLAFEADTFDVVASQHGVTLFPDMAGALREMVRVVKPGGAVVVATFGPLERAGFVATFLDAIRAAVPEAPVPTREDPPLPFQASDPEELARRLEAAGLEHVRVETFTEEATFPSAERFWATLVSSNPIGARLDASLTDDQRGRALKNVESMFADRPGPEGGGVVSSEINVGIGVKPGEGV